MTERIVTVTYKTDNNYTAVELDMVKSAMLETVLELDDYADKSSMTISAMSEAESQDAKAMAVVEFLNESQITSTLSIVPPTGGAPITVDFHEVTEED